ncbi:MAG: hypothetical protein EBZ50_14070, partial [Alphaproteobacteria bacterium]|nr:hypothetical protein [Alphaproteobacteria bacterium]
MLLDYATARALLDTLDRLAQTDPAVRALRDRLWDAIIEANPGLEFDPTSVLVMFAAGATEEQRAFIRASIGGGVVETWNSVPGLEHLVIPGSVAEALGVVSLLGETTGVVEFVEPDLIAHIGATS